ncbi:homoserine kinase [Paraliobacillus ryukyuensis]|uniref:homoserine kinase n=1 Tax=Paraliobacillus ryukyuensis TaxID=200904 RepID=UPI0009A579CA|nr:homoserine kinase [Paraliobacillus ryukyuensis]
MSWVIHVPATTANLGAGFDSIGVALNLYLTLEVAPSDEWEFIALTEEVKALPTDKQNLIYKIGRKVAKKFGYQSLPPSTVRLTSHIPLARGLGSSATAIIAGIELADVLLELNLSKSEKLEIATAIEGHPDNVAPSLLGGCVIGHYDQQLDWIQIPINDLIFLAIIPPYELKTTQARAVLPKSFSYQESVQASAVANVSTAAICQGDWDLLGKMMKKDHFHQSYRKKLIPHYDEVTQLVEKDVYGTFLSGAGPTMITLTTKAVVDRQLDNWKKTYPNFQWLALEVDNQGVVTKVN